MQERPPVRPWEIASVLLVLAVTLGLAALWVLSDQGPLLEHSGRSIQDSILLWRRLAAGLVFVPDDYPPLASLVSAGFYAVWGPSRLVALASQFVFLVPYLAGAWWTGRELGGRAGGTLTLLAAAGNPWMSLHLHGYYLEVGTTSLVALALALLLAARGGRNPAPTLALGVVAGLGMLSKWSWLLFMGPGLLWPLVLAWKAGPRNRRMAGAAVACLAFTALMLLAARPEASHGFPWLPYGLCLVAWALLGALAARSWRRAGWSPAAGIALSWGLAFLVGAWWYFLSAWELQTKAAGDAGQGVAAGVCLARLLATLSTCTWAAPAWFALGSLAALRIRELRVPTLVAWSGIALFLGFYAVWQVPPGPRYALPATVLVLAVSFAWLGRFPRCAFLAGLLLLAVGWLQVGSWTLQPPRVSWAAGPDLEQSRWLVRLSPPRPSGPPVGATAERIVAELEGTGESAITSVLLPEGRLDPDVLILESILRGRELDIRHILDRDPARPVRTSLLLLVGEAPPSSPWLADFHLVESWQASGWGAWSLYRRKAPGVGWPTESPGRAPPPGPDRSRLFSGE